MDDDRITIAVHETLVESAPHIVGTVITPLDVDEAQRGADRPRSARTSGKPTAYNPTAPDPAARTHNLNRTPELAKRVLRRIEAGDRTHRVEGLRADQRAMAVELVESGRSIEDVARAFSVTDDVVRRLVE